VPKPTVRRCRTKSQSCNAGSLKCCGGLKCHSTKKTCVACKAKWASCTASSQCCTGLRCIGSPRKCR
jgi:hypothetical protein